VTAPTVSVTGATTSDNPSATVPQAIQPWQNAPTVSVTGATTSDSPSATVPQALLSESGSH
jgi:hypothetical protein